MKCKWNKPLSVFFFSLFVSFTLALFFVACASKLTVRTNPTRFVFGGQDTIAKSTAEDLYVLTLPGFVWTKLDNPQGGARTDHVCVVAGKRQMVTVGGIKRLGGGDSFRLADPFPQGLGVFDMTELSWGTDFKADAAEYESPQIVQDWYDKNGYVCDLPRDGWEKREGTLPGLCGC